MTKFGSHIRTETPFRGLTSIHRGMANQLFCLIQLTESWWCMWAPMKTVTIGSGMACFLRECEIKLQPFSGTSIDKTADAKCVKIKSTMSSAPPSRVAINPRIRRIRMKNITDPRQQTPAKGRIRDTKLQQKARQKLPYLYQYTKVLATPHQLFVYFHMNHYY